MIRIGVIGAAGYVGGELLRLLLLHPQLQVVFAQSRHLAAQPWSAAHPDLALLGDGAFVSEGDLSAVDLVFLALGHGESLQWWQQNKLPAGLKVIDMSQDFRLDEKEGFVYGLPEFQRERIAEARYVANPGCFATALQLALLPLAAAGELAEVHATGITGSTGAGRSLGETSHFSWRANNLAAYKSLQHQHLAEVQQTLSKSGGAAYQNLHFVPWRGDFTRGIFASLQFKTALSLDALNSHYAAYYAGHPFTALAKGSLDLKQVLQTNHALLALEKVGEQAVVHVALDNLLKGAAGQAVQNMNLMFQLSETAGLRLKSGAF
ncbi:MAG: N-acetyl-gamma-glutamyl-phosphate reductase [Sphingobacteriaceae bacterium]|nr:N-acetyl-gamma-glutamyl-phosphate reductase [Sphingobacteriaceae bacterium]